MVFSCEFCAIFQNQATKSGQLIEREKEIFFFKNHAENEVGGLVSDLLLSFKNTLQKIRASGESYRSQGLKLD